MKITIKFAQHVRALAKTKQIIVELDENAHLSDLLKVLTARYGVSLMDSMYASEMSHLDVWPSIIVNGQVVLLPLITKSDIELKEGSEVVLIAPVSGG